MRISELAAAAELSLATVKYYLRIGLLPAGERVSATESRYGEDQLRRLRLIRALREVVGLPIERIAEILSAVDEPSETTYATLGRAIGALARSKGDHPSKPESAEPESKDPEQFPRARAAIGKLGLTYDPGFPAVAQLEQALAAAESVGVGIDDERLAVLGKHLLAMAEFDLSRMPADPVAAVEYAVLGTALHEPVVLALRRLSHQHLAARAGR